MDSVLGCLDMHRQGEGMTAVQSSCGVVTIYANLFDLGVQLPCLCINHQNKHVHVASVDTTLRCHKSLTAKQTNPSIIGVYPHC